MNVNREMSQQIFQILTKASLESLNAGDILNGRVQSLENSMLLIKLLDGTSFTAKTPEGFSAGVGELITLEIGERQNNQLTAKIVNKEPREESVANKEAILANTIKSNLEYLGAERPENLVLKVLELIKADPKLAPDQASFIVANKLPDNPQMGEILRKVSEHEFSLHNNLQSLQNGISEAIDKMEGENAVKLLKPILVNQELDELSLQVKPLLAEAHPKLADSIIQNIKDLLTKILLDETSAQNNESEESLGKYNSIILPQTRENILELINKTLRNIHTKSDRISKGEEGQSLNKEIRSILKKLFDKTFIRVENGIVEKIDIEEKTKALKDIMKFSQKALNAMDKSAKESNMPAFKEIDTAFKFFEQVTTYNSILQLPLKINRENTTGELYVMKRINGRRKIDTENFTLFLSLTTNSIGLVESFLNATKKRITISFRVEEDGLVKLFKDNYRSLYEGLLEKGFILVDMKCRLLDGDRADVLNAGTRVDEILGTQNRLDLKI